MKSLILKKISLILAPFLFLTLPATGAITPKDSITKATVFIDSLTNENLRKGNVPGAVVTIVKNGRLVFNKGYGYADIESKRMVDPDKTVFRVASITKPFTAIAILQLVEKEKINLHQDLRPILSKIHDFDWKYPLTLHDIMTHKSGLDYSRIGSHRISASNNEIRTKLPNQVYKPGTFQRYSNVAFGLLEHVIEEVSGEGYFDYMKDHILLPLGMNNSTFDTVLPSRIATSKAETYLNIDGNLVKQKRQYLRLPAASSLETTGKDMAQFMMALENPDVFVKKGVMNKETFQLYTEAKNGQAIDDNMGYGIARGNTNNNPTLWHSGGVRGFLSLMTVHVDQGYGIFVAQNNRYGSEYFGWSTVQQIEQHFIPKSKADLSYIKKTKITTPISSFEGVYEGGMVPQATFEKAQGILDGDESLVQVVNDSTLSVDGEDFYRLNNTVFVHHKQNSEYLREFTLDSEGNVDLMLSGFRNMRKISIPQTLLFRQIFFGLGLLLLLIFTGVTIWRWRSSKRKSSVIIYPYEKWSVLISIGYILSFGALLLCYFVLDTLKEGVPFYLKIPLGTMTFTAIGFAFFPWAIWNMMRSNATKKSKIFQVTYIVLLMIFTLYFNELNLIGMKW